MIPLLVISNIMVVHGAEDLDVNFILKQVRERPDGKDIYTDLKLVLIDKNGRLRECTLIYLQKDYGKDEKLTLCFTVPDDVKGVTLQTFNYDEASNKEDAQWLYLPAFRQIRKVSSADKRGSFMGSEFSYYDLDKLRVYDYKQKIVGEEKFLDKNCHVVERIPVTEKIINKAGYYKTVLWIDKNTNIVLKQTYYNEKGVLFKEMNVRRLEKIQSIWTVMEAEMTNYLKENKSHLIFSNIRYNVGLSDKFFHKNIMREGIHVEQLP